MFYWIVKSDMILEEAFNLYLTYLAAELEAYDLFLSLEESSQAHVVVI